MKILIFGGTTEGRILTDELKKRGHTITVSCATKVGEEMLDSQNCEVLVGRMNADEMMQIVPNYDLVVDATHPYAKLVTEEIKKACEQKGCRLVRIRRRSQQWDEDVTVVKSVYEAAECLAGSVGNVLITTGAKELSAFREILPERLFPRVLPTQDGIAACSAIGIPAKNIIAMFGPFSEELNLALIDQYDIRVLVTKESGQNGGFQQKMEAARKRNVSVILIERPDDSGVSVELFLQEVDKYEN